MFIKTTKENTYKYPYKVNFMWLVDYLGRIRTDIHTCKKDLLDYTDRNSYETEDNFHFGFWGGQFHGLYGLCAWESSYINDIYRNNHFTMNGYIALDAKRLFSTNQSVSRYDVSRHMGFSVDRYGILRVGGIPCQKNLLASLDDSLFNDMYYPDEHLILTKTGVLYTFTQSDSEFLRALAQPGLISIEAVEQAIKLCTSEHILSECSLYEDTFELVGSTIGSYEFFCYGLTVTMCTPGRFVTWPKEYNHSVIFFTTDRYRYLNMLRYMRDAMHAGAETITITETRFGVLKVNNQICYYDRVPLEAFDSDPLKAIPLPKEWYYRKPASPCPPGPHIVGITKAVE